MIKGFLLHSSFQEKGRFYGKLGCLLCCGVFEFELYIIGGGFRGLKLNDPNDPNQKDRGGRDF